MKTKKFCPNCGSTNIKWVIPQNWSMWRCYDCGYYGAVVIEDGEMACEIRKDYLKKHEEKEKEKEKENEE